VVSSVDIFSVLGAPLFAVIGVMVLSSVCISLVLSLHSSIGLSPVSMLSWIFIPSVLRA